MSNKLSLLKSEILKDIEKIDRLFAKFVSSYQEYEERGIYAHLVEAAFYANQLYSGFETIFKNIAASFENTITDEAWHKSLLDRMAIAVEDIRPALISEANYHYLNELRAFRHFFRHAYDLEIDKEKFAIVAARTLKLKENYKPDLDKFLQFIDALLKK